MRSIVPSVENPASSAARAQLSRSWPLVPCTALGSPIPMSIALPPVGFLGPGIQSRAGQAMIGACRRTARGTAGFLAETEGRMVRGDPPELIVARIRADAAEEHPDLSLPTLEVCAQDRGTGVLGDLGRGELLAAPTEQQPAAAAGAEVADPLGVAAGRDEIPLAVVGEQVDRGAPRLAGLAAGDL